jgi:hypothetical protein
MRSPRTDEPDASRLGGQLSAAPVCPDTAARGNHLLPRRARPPCGPEAAYMWCWSAGPRWYYVRDHPVPAGNPLDGVRW